MSILLVLCFVCCLCWCACVNKLEGAIVSECGIVSSIGTPLISGGKKAERSEVPWHAGIYNKTADHGYQQICGGTLIRDSIVLSAAHCFWNDYDGKPHPVANYAVAVGKLHRSWSHDKDKHSAQTSNVTALHLPPLFKASISNYHDDIAVVVTIPFQFTVFVRPVCVDFNDVFQTTQLKVGNMGKAAGWGLTSANGPHSQALNVIDLPFVSSDTCYEDSPYDYRGYITSGVICAGYKNKHKALCKGDSGGGLAFPQWERGIPRFYLRGIVSTAPPNDDKCNDNFYTVFTQIMGQEKFIKKYWNNGAQCYLPSEPSVNYRCPKFGLVEGFRECDKYESNGTVVRPQCRSPNYFSATALKDMQCIDGNWNYIAKCSQSEQCYLPSHPSVDYRCIDIALNEGSRACSEYENNGTVVRPACRSSDYYSESDLTDMQCIDGNWNYTAKCSQLECGIVSSVGTPLISGGESAKRAEVPWHAGVYSTTTRPYQQICGGTLISNSVVISGAVCFFKYNELKPRPAAEYAVAVGKLYRPWSANEDQHSAQRSNVTAIHLPLYFQGSESNYQGDLAVVVVTVPFKFTTFVRPACVDFDISLQNTQLKAGNKGKLAGWGITENGGPPQVLKVVDLPYVSAETCITDSPLDFRGYITFDKFCAGFKNEHKAVCRGDGGGGLVFPKYDEKGSPRFYIRGVVSTAPGSKNLCNVNFYTTFTQVLKYEHFIKQFWKTGAAAVQCYLPSRSSVKYRCVDFGRFEGPRDCHEYEGNGTVARPQCRSPNYYSETALKDMLCIDGNWNYIAKCSRVAECGIVSSVGTPYISGGESAKRAEVPWHAGIYNKTADHGYQHICGGTLISNNVVLSAAVCFWSELEGKQLPAAGYAVAVGKLYRPWSADEDKDSAQTSNVKAVYLPSQFLGGAANFQDDIAVLVVTIHFRFTTFVQPVCVDFDYFFQIAQLKVGNMGKVAGWGVNAAHGSSSPVLQVIDLPFVSIETCISDLPYSSRAYITPDKFCAGLINESKGLCRGDSGGGLTFPEWERGIQRFYLRGITSSEPTSNSPCNEDHYSTFTQILSYEHFIKQFLEHEEPCHLKPHPSVEYRCLISGNVGDNRPCNEFESSGTVASPRCRSPGYFSVAALGLMTCLEGTWNYIATCYQELPCKEDALDISYGETPAYSMNNESLQHVSVRRDSAGLLHYFEMHVAIQADELVGIYLSDKVNSSDIRYHIYVGRGSNQYTDLEHPGATVQHIHTPDILSYTQFRIFYIKINNGTLQFGKEGGSRPLVSHYDAGLRSLAYFGFSNLGYNVAKIRYDCPAPELGHC